MQRTFCCSLRGHELRSMVWSGIELASLARHGDRVTMHGVALAWRFGNNSAFSIPRKHGGPDKSTTSSPQDGRDHKPRHTPHFVGSPFPFRYYVSELHSSRKRRRPELTKQSYPARWPLVVCKRAASMGAILVRIAE